MKSKIRYTFKTKDGKYPVSPSGKVEWSSGFNKALEKGRSYKADFVVELINKNGKWMEGREYLINEIN